jgi:urate oxidase
VRLFKPSLIIDLAKKNPVSPPELFASIVAAHFPTTYKHITGARCSVIQHKWTRIMVDGKPHKHSFLRDGEDVRIAKSYFQRNKGFLVTSGLENLLVLKSTGSAFHGHIKDKYTLLPDVYDRIFSTEVTCHYNWRLFKTLEEIKKYDGFDAAFEGVKDTTTSTFATDDSASVQATLYKMTQIILGKFKDVDDVSYALPNKHYFQIDMGITYELRADDSIPPNQKHRPRRRSLQTRSLPCRSPIHHATNFRLHHSNGIKEEQEQTLR